jgi:hypothetical protein
MKIQKIFSSCSILVASRGAFHHFPLSQTNMAAKLVIIIIFLVVFFIRAVIYDEIEANSAGVYLFWDKNAMHHALH